MATGTRRLTRRPRPQPGPMAKPTAVKGVPREHAELYEHYSVCRAEGHEWQHLGLQNGQQPAQRFDGCYPFASRCRNCGSERTKWFYESGRSAGSEYRYSDHYQQRGDGKLDRDDWGRLFIRSHLGGK